VDRFNLIVPCASGALVGEKAPAVQGISSLTSLPAGFEMSTSEGTQLGPSVPAVPAWLLSASAPLDLGKAAPVLSYLQGSYSGAGQQAQAVAAKAESKKTEGADEQANEEDEEEDILPETEEEKVTVAKIRDGFRIREMTMRNGDTGKVVWTSKDMGPEVLFDSEGEAHLPASMLQASSVTRSITFSSVELMKHFFMTQKVYLHGQLLEKHEFDFGFVIPNSTNSWEQQIEAADDEVGTLDAALLSGSTTVVTKFYDKGLLIGQCSVRLFYNG
jgi:retinal rod rhodopsin-sensitive cGMP 3',5'-cyclic phosphodiesterase subunit delta